MSLSSIAWLASSALAAGAVNSVAGGGTLLTFPALLSLIAPVAANATSTVALVPGSLAGAWAYRRELRATGRAGLLLLWPSLAGGAIGAFLLTRLPERWFAALVPWLILTASVLLLIHPFVARVSRENIHDPPGHGLRSLSVVLFQFLVAVYGGYFGAGIGILMLSALGLMGLGDIHRMNALKTLLAACINAVAVVIFVAEGAVRWDLAVPMAAAAVVGGYLGGRTARRLNPDFVRWIVVAIGFGLAAYFFATAHAPAMPSTESAIPR